MGLTDQFANSLGGIFGGGQQSQAALAGYGISGAYGISANTYTPYITTVLSAPTIRIDGTYYDYARDRPLTNAEWLDRRIDEMRVRL